MASVRSTRGRIVVSCSRAHRHLRRCTQQQQQQQQQRWLATAAATSHGLGFSTTAAPSSVNEISQRVIADLTAQPVRPLSLADLVRHGRPPLSTNALLSSANFSLSLIPNRLAHRLQALRNLPYIVVSNPHIAKIHQNYTHSLSTLLPYSNSSIQTLEEEIKFTEVMADLVQTHSNTIPYLARGFLECRRYISPDLVKRFLDEHLRARIGTRLIAEQHIALHLSSQAHSKDSPSSQEHNTAPPTEQQHDTPPTHVGVIDSALKPAQVIRQCESFVGEICELRYGVRPSVVITGQPDVCIAHVPTHLEYMVTELLKNAFRATVENGKQDEPVEVTIAATSPPNEDDGASDTLEVPLRDMASSGAAVAGISASSPPPSAASIDQDDPLLTTPTPGVTIRIRDRGGGISPAVFPHIWNYSFTTFNDDAETSAGVSLHQPNASAKVDASATGIGMLSAVANGAAVGVGGAATAAGGGVPGARTGGIGGATSSFGSSLAGLGYGLPLGRAYAEHFGGEIKVQSLWGWGTDVYLKLKGLGGG